MSVPPKPIVNIETHDEPVVRLTQVAAYLGVDPRTVRKWVQAGLLRAFQLPGGDWRVEIDRVRAFIEEHRLRASEPSSSAPRDAREHTTHTTG